MKKKRLFSCIAAIVSTVTGIVAGVVISKKMTPKTTFKDKELADKHLAILLLFNQWMITKQEEKSIATYLEKQGVKKVAIYGMSYLGERLYDELKDSPVEVVYAIDRNADGIFVPIPVVTPEEELAMVDMIIVTAVYYFDEIADMLAEKTDAKITSLEDIVYDMQ